MINSAPSLPSAVLRLLEPATIQAAAAELRRREQVALANAARRSFAEFVRQAWHLSGTTEPLQWGWHLDALCLHLQAVEEGQIRRLLINIPPGHAKSKLVSVLYPAWCWARSPERQFLCASYAHQLAERDSVYGRQLVESEWYRAAFMQGWSLKPDQNAKSFWANTREGHRMAIGVGGTGHRADRIVIDDPLSAVDAFSKAARDEATRWIGQTLTTRFNDPATGAVVMIMQRLHEEDPSSFVLAGGGWEHLMLPSEFEPDRRCVTHATVQVPANGTPAHAARVEMWRDPRTEAGELLFPAKFPREVLTTLRAPNALGEVGYAGQHQQRPAPEGGGMFKVLDWRFHKPDGKAPDHSAHRPRGCYDGPANPLPARWDRIQIHVDGTFKETASGSYVAIHVWGASGSRRCILDRDHRRMDYDACEQALVGDRSRGRTFPIGGMLGRWPGYELLVVEDKANGSALVKRLSDVLGIPRVLASAVNEGGKQQRASVFSLPYVRAGNVELPDGAPWLDEYIGEHAAFPLGKWNDDVDCQSQGLAHLEQRETDADVMVRLFKQR